MVAMYYALVTLKERHSADPEKGATAVEYGLLVGLIAVVIIAAVTLLGTQLNTLFLSITGALGGGGAG